MFSVFVITVMNGIRLCRVIFLYVFTELQLKPEHKPVQHLKNWKSRIVVMFTDQDPEKEDAQLFWRRDAILTIDMEKKVVMI